MIERFPVVNDLNNPMEMTRNGRPVPLTHTLVEKDAIVFHVLMFGPGG